MLGRSDKPSTVPTRPQAHIVRLHKGFRYMVVEPLRTGSNLVQLVQVKSSPAPNLNLNPSEPVQVVWAVQAEPPELDPSEPVQGGVQN